MSSNKLKTTCYRKQKAIVAFDLDGVLVDNVAFEHAVTNYIIQQLSSVEHISIQDARQEWNRVLRNNQQHPRWHDYSLHCENLNLGDVWKEAHLLNRDLLKKYNYVDEAIDVVRNNCDCWVISDATEWVINFKLTCIGHSKTFSEIFSSSRCGHSKHVNDFWSHVSNCLPQISKPFVFVENRIDNLLMAKKQMPYCIPIWINTPDHPLETGAIPIVSVATNKFNATTHQMLPETLRSIMDNL